VSQNDLIAIDQDRLCLVYCSFVIAWYPGKPLLHTAQSLRVLSCRVNSVKYVVVSVLCDQDYGTYTGCPRRNVPDFGRVFLMLNYTDITQNT